MHVTAHTHTTESFTQLLWDSYGSAAPAIAAQVSTWLARGDGAAVYEDHDLSSPSAGEVMLVSYGSPSAQLETPEPPDILPDTTTSINWRFVLAGTYRGAALTLQRDTIQS